MINPSGVDITKKQPFVIRLLKRMDAYSEKRKGPEVSKQDVAGLLGAKEGKGDGKQGALHCTAVHLTHHPGGHNRLYTCTHIARRKQTTLNPCLVQVVSTEEEAERVLLGFPRLSS